jgi:hypothetical protein
MKQIMISLENAQKAIKKIETDGASELAPLNPFDEKQNLLYDPEKGKLYQSVGGIFKEVGYVDRNL